MTSLGIGVSMTRGRGGGRADISAWLTRVASGGGSVSAATADAVSAFAYTVAGIGLTDANCRINLFAGTALTAALYPVFRGGGADADTNVSFVSGDYTEATGLTGDGATKYLNTGIVPAASMGHMSAYTRASLGTSNAVVIGCQNAGATEIYALRKGGSTATRGYWGGTANATVTETMIGGHYAVSRTGAGALDLYRSGGSIATSGSAGGAGVTETAYVFASNNGGTAGAFISASVAMGGYSIGPALSAAQIATLASAFQSCMAALGRAV